MLKIAGVLLPVLFFVILIGLWRGSFSAPGLGDPVPALSSPLIGQPLPSVTLTHLLPPSPLFHTAQLHATGQPMLLHVWGSWCATCRRGHAFLQQLAQQGVVIMSVNYKDRRDHAIAWLQQQGDPYRLTLYDPHGELAFELGVWGAPETFIVDGAGIIRYRHVGELNTPIWQQVLAPLYERLLEERP